MFLRKIWNKYLSLPKQAKGSIWFLICSFLQRGISVITTPIFTRLLSTTEYGQYSVFNSWYSIIIIFASLSLYNGVYTQGLVKFDQERSVFSSSLQGLTLTSITLTLLIYLASHRFWNELLGQTTVQMLAMFVLMWTSSSFSFWSVEQRVNLKYENLLAITIAVSLAKPIVGIFLVMNAENRVMARIMGLVIVELAAYSWTFFAQMRRGKSFIRLITGAMRYASACRFCRIICHKRSSTVPTGS